MKIFLNKISFFLFILVICASCGKQGQSFSSLFDRSAQVFGIVTDSMTGEPLEGAVVASVSANRSTTTNERGLYWFEDIDLGAFDMTVSLARFAKETYNGIAVSGENRIDFSLEPDNPDIIGDVTNALTGMPLPGATLVLASTGQTVISDANGQFTYLDVAPGPYIINATMAGFVPERATGTLVLGADETVHIVMTPTVPQDQLRVVLTWDVSPRDLDTHFFGDLDSGEQYHVYDITQDGTNANLDVDDVTSYGPETLTLTSTDAGHYSYHVYDFTNGNNSEGDGTLAASGVTVKVYQGNNLTRTFTATNTGSEVSWHVFDLDISASGNVTITRINAYSNINLNDQDTWP